MTYGRKTPTPLDSKKLQLWIKIKKYFPFLLIAILSAFLAYGLTTNGRKPITQPKTTDSQVATSRPTTSAICQIVAPSECTEILSATFYPIGEYHDIFVQITCATNGMGPIDIAANHVTNHGDTQKWHVVVLNTEK